MTDVEDDRDCTDVEDDRDCAEAGEFASALKAGMSKRCLNGPSHRQQCLQDNKPLAAGVPVEIHYNPENPVESVLDPRAWPLLLLWLIPAAVFALGYAVAR